MIKQRLRIQYALILIGLLLILPLLIAATLVKTNLNDIPVEEIDYIPEDIQDNYLPVLNSTTKIILPYLGENVSIAKTYYDYKAEESSQLKSILLHDNTYIQNTGIDYVGKDTFDVVSILDGTVVSIKEDATIGKTVEIKHDNDYISIYQSLSDIYVKKGDIIAQGQLIGKSGINELEKDLGNHLHFEMYDKGQVVNPENYFNKEVTIEKGN